MQSPEGRHLDSLRRAVSSVYCKAIVALANANVCVNPKKQQTAGATRGVGCDTAAAISAWLLFFVRVGKERVCNAKGI